MANMEMQLVSRILRKGQLNEALEWGITLEDFLTDEARHYIATLLAWRSSPSSKGGQMGHQAAQIAFPNFDICDDDVTPLDYLCTEVRKNRLRVEARTAAQRIIELVDGDPLEAVEAGQRACKQISELGYGKRSDVRFSEALERNVNHMKMIKAGIDMSAAQWPWKTINDATMGIQPDDYIVLYGRPKSMKSWVLSYMIAMAYDAGKRPLIYTKEMHPDNIFLRVAACLAKLPYQELRTGRLTAEEEERLEYLLQISKEMQGSDDMICLSGRDAPGGRDTVEWLQAKVEKHKPDLVYIDGMYLMTDGQGGKNQKDNYRVQNISRGLRQMVLTTRKPLIATLQANRQAAKHNNAELDEIAFTDAIGQDATTIIRVINEKTGPTIGLVMGGSREYELHGLRIYGIPATDFSEKETMTEKDISKAREGDTADTEANPSGHAKPVTNGKNGHTVAPETVVDIQLNMQREANKRLDRTARKLVKII
jgi:hypothetical protein